MHLFKILILALFLPTLGFSNPFEAKEWDPYRLNNPTQSQQPLSTERLRGIPVTDDSFDKLLAAGNTLFSQEKVLKYWAGSRTDTPENKANWVKFLGRAKNRTSANLLSWRGFYLASDPETFVGFAGAHRHPDTKTPFDGSIEIVYAFDANHWKKGYAIEALTAYITTDIGRLDNYKYIFAAMHPENVNSAKVTQRLGLQEWSLDQKDPHLAEHLKRENRKFWRLDKK